MSFSSIFVLIASFSLAGLDNYPFSIILSCFLLNNLFLQIDHLLLQVQAHRTLLTEHIIWSKNLPVKWMIEDTWKLKYLDAGHHYVLSLQE